MLGVFDTSVSAGVIFQGKHIVERCHGIWLGVVPCLYNLINLPEAGTRGA